MFFLKKFLWMKNVQCNAFSFTMQILQDLIIEIYSCKL